MYNYLFKILTIRISRLMWWCMIAFTILGLVEGITGYFLSFGFSISALDN